MPYLTHTKIAHLAQKDNTPHKNAAPHPPAIWLCHFSYATMRGIYEAGAVAPSALRLKPQCQLYAAAMRLTSTPHSLIGHHSATLPLNNILYYFTQRTGCLPFCWLEYMPVTHGVAGSSPVRTAINNVLRNKHPILL